MGFTARLIVYRLPGCLTETGGGSRWIQVHGDGSPLQQGAGGDGPSPGLCLPQQTFRFIHAAPALGADSRTQQRFAGALIIRIALCKEREGTLGHRHIIQKPRLACILPARLGDGIGSIGGGRFSGTGRTTDAKCADHCGPQELSVHRKPFASAVFHGAVLPSIILHEPLN